MSIAINSEERVRDIVVIGASTGGFAAINTLLSLLPSDIAAVVGIVLHRGSFSPTDWSKSLGYKACFRVVEPKHGERLEQGIAYVAPSDQHMTFELGHVSLDSSIKQHFTRPAIDPLFSSAALAYASRVVGVVLTGRGEDGTRGLLNIAGAGGLALVQTPDEAASTPMPAYALLHDHVRAALTLDQLANVLPRLARGLSIEIDGS